MAGASQISWTSVTLASLAGSLSSALLYALTGAAVCEFSEYRNGVRSSPRGRGSILIDRTPPDRERKPVLKRISNVVRAKRFEQLRGG
jgi:hypothetical protein